MVGGASTRLNSSTTHIASNASKNALPSTMAASRVYCGCQASRGAMAGSTTRTDGRRAASPASMRALRWVASRNSDSSGASSSRRVRNSLKRAANCCNAPRLPEACCPMRATVSRAALTSSRASASAALWSDRASCPLLCRWLTTWRSSSARRLLTARARGSIVRYSGV